MKIILLATYGLCSALALVTGWVYPDARAWSHMAVGAFSGHLVLAFAVSLRSVPDAGKIAAWCWQGVSALLVAALLVPYGLGQGGGWLIAALTVAGFTVLVTLVLALVLRRNEPATRPHPSS